MTAQPPPPHSGRQLSEAERSQILDNVLISRAAAGGTVVTRTSTSAVLVFGRPINHLLHLVLSLVCCGFWLIVWFALALFGGQKREVITIDQYGNAITRTENPQKTLQIVLGALLALWLLLAVIGSCSAATHHDSNSGGSSMSEMQAVSH
jgi:hypothetical protein